MSDSVSHVGEVSDRAPMTSHGKLCLAASAVFLFAVAAAMLDAHLALWSLCLAIVDNAIPFLILFGVIVAVVLVLYIYDSFPTFSKIFGTVALLGIDLFVWYLVFGFKLHDGSAPISPVFVGLLVLAPTALGYCCVKHLTRSKTLLSFACVLVLIHFVVVSFALVVSVVRLDWNSEMALPIAEEKFLERHQAGSVDAAIIRVGSHRFFCSGVGTVNCVDARYFLSR